MGNVAPHPVTIEVVRNSLPAAADEMADGLARSSYNMMIYEVRDFSCAILDAEGRLLCQNVGGVSHFVADLGVVIRDAVARIGVAGFRPGDGFITNHQRVCGQHLNNVVAVTPVFAAGDLLGFAVVRAHWVDIGGMSTGFGAAGEVVTDPWIEGLQLDLVRVQRDGAFDDQLVKLIMDNVRYPEAALGDLRAQLAACRAGAQRLEALVARYGRDAVTQLVERIFSDSEQRCRKIVEQIPDGEYQATAALDHDLLDRHAPLEIEAKVIVAGSDMTIDLTGCGRQRRSSINSRTLAAAYVAYKAVTMPLEPVNEGSFAALTVRIDEGNFMMAQFPAPMAKWSIPIPTVVDTILRALAPALPGRVPAAHHASLGGGVAFFGTDPASGRRFVLCEISPAVGGVYSQICRTVVLGPASQPIRDDFDLLSAALMAGADACRPGVPVSAVVEAMDAVIGAAGFADYCRPPHMRARGHGLGLASAMPGDLTQRNHRPLVAGDVFVLHPNQYLPGSGYLLCGEPLTVTPAAGVPLTSGFAPLAEVC